MPTPPAAPRTPQEYSAVGRGIRREIADEIGPGIDPDDAAWAWAFRGILRRRLREERRAGAVEADATPRHRPQQHVDAAQRMRRAAGDLPASWVDAGNAHGKVLVKQLPDNKDGGWYKPVPVQKFVDGKNRKVGYEAAITGRGVDEGLDVALHEYVHHLQNAMPGLQALFRREHRRRTTHDDGTRHKIKPLPPYTSVRGQEDDYIKALVYAGRRYPWDDDDPLEVITAHFQAVLRSFHGREVLHRLASDDPGMLDLVLGTLFRYDPTP